MGKSVSPRFKLFIGEDDQNPKCFHSVSEAIGAFLDVDIDQSARLMERTKKTWNERKSKDAGQYVHRP